MPQKLQAVVEAEASPTNTIRLLYKWGLARLYSYSKYRQLDYDLHVGSSCSPNHQQRMCDGLIAQHILLTAFGVSVLFPCSLTLTNHLTKLFLKY